MQKGESSSGRRAGSGGVDGRTPQDFQKIFHRLKDLHQIQDESRNELCPVFLQEESLIKSRRGSDWSWQQPQVHPNILNQLEQPSPHTGHNPLVPSYSSKRSYYNLNQDQNLRQSNKKLQEDNKKLFTQCLRLKKICQLYETKQAVPTQNSSFTLQLSRLESQNRQLKHQIQQLQQHHQKLLSQVKNMQQQINTRQSVTERYNRTTLQLQEVSRINADMEKRMLELQKELEIATTRVASKSSESLSINNSTQQSRKAEVERDRMIINMKIVHQSQKVKLKNQIQDLKKELSKHSQSSSFSNLVNLKRK